MCGRTPAARQWRAGFTLAEVLAALVFMAIVIPVAVQGVRIAARAGQVAERKVEAARVAERLLNEIIVTHQGEQSAQSGTVLEGARKYRWHLRNENWDKDALRLLTMEVIFIVQGDEYDVHLSTLWDSSSTAETAQQ
jgi:type II secretory pathway pseudopilin PulG